MAYKREVRSIFLYGFPKNAKENLEQKDLEDLKRLARVFATLSDAEISKATLERVLVEVKEGDEEISK